MPRKIHPSASLASSFLHVSEVRSKTTDLAGDYDLLIFLGTWESRGDAIARSAQLTASVALIGYFDPSHAPAEVIQETVARIRDGISGNVENIEVLALNRSVDFHESLNILSNRVNFYCTGFGAKLPRIGIDISSIPIGYVQGLVGYLIQSGLTAFVDCFYVEPKYEDRSNTEGSNTFTSGGWQLSPVPYLEGKTIGSPDKYIFVCIGAETGNTRELLLGREYTQAAIIKPTHGKLSHWSDQIDRDCDELVSSVNVLGDTYQSANAFSVVDVARYYADVVAPSWRNSQRMFVAIGTKPHGLAGVICSFSDPSLSVFARVPSGYLTRDVMAGEYSWRYSLRDLSSPIWASLGYPSWD